MSEALSPRLRHALRRSRFLVRSAQATEAVGERRSRARGAGIEFADYRAYQPGDDFRHLDRHVYARLKRPVIKQFSVEQGLSISVLLDTSSSMSVGSPSKLAKAVELAAVLAYVALMGKDRVLVGSFSSGSVAWHPLLTSAQRLPQLLDWLSRLRAAGAAELTGVARKSSKRLTGDGLLFVISDWLVDDIPLAVSTWGARGQELVAIQVLAPEDISPPGLSRGSLRAVDIETGASLEKNLGQDAVSRYQAELSTWRAEVASAVTLAGGRFFWYSSSAPVEQIVLKDWRGSGLIR